MYLHKFVEGLGDDELPTSVRDKALKSLELGKPSEALQTVLMEMNDSLVFADLSSLHNTEHAVDLLNILNACLSSITLIFAVSSSAQYFTDDGEKGLLIKTALKIYFITVHT